MRTPRMGDGSSRRDRETPAVGRARVAAEGGARHARRRALATATVVVALCWVGLLGPYHGAAAGKLPRSLSDRDFARIMSEFSEPNGFFRSDNLISNEMTFQEVIPELRTRASTDGVYLGVGPDQNFTYITALRPRMAFIVDIRRGNMMEHLLYKAIIEMSDDRADFLSRLFCRPRPSGLTSSTSADALLAAYADAAGDAGLFQTNMDAVWTRLVKRHGFHLDNDDRQSIEYVYRAFLSEGPQLRYSFPRQNFGARWFPTYAELMTTADADGRNHGYLADEDSFRFLREFERSNLLVPIVGDFGGDKAIRAVGRYVREHGGTVNYVYTSNVEQYLFQSDAWQRYYDNIATLPVDDHSTFIRAYFNRGFRYPPGIITADLHSIQLLDPVSSLLSAFRAGTIRTYNDVVERSTQ
ncbi:MAG: hypothetical protein ABUS56_02560 [Acidobacteriota bacterium]